MASHDLSRSGFTTPSHTGIGIICPEPEGGLTPGGEAINVLILLSNRPFSSISHQHLSIGMLDMKDDLLLEWFGFCLEV